MDRINGFGKGSKSQEILHPACSILVKKEGNNFTAINHEDQRISSFLGKYNESTKIEVIIINNSDIEKVTFIAKELIQQLTAPISFNSFFTNIIKNTQHQIWTRDFFSIDPNKKNTTLKFNTQAFSKCFGANIPSLSTLNKIKEEIRKNNEPLISKTPTQIKTPQQSMMKLSDTTPKNKKTNTNDYSYEDFENIWNNNIKSKYSYDYAVKKTSNKNNSKFLERLNNGLIEYKSETNSSKEFKKNLEIFLDKEFSNE